MLDSLAREQLEIALCGGVALGLHGFVRATKDFDLLVREDDVERAKANVAALGFTLAAAPMTFKRGRLEETVVHRVSKSLGSSLLTIGFLLARGYLAEVWAGRQVVEWSGRRVAVVSASGLIEMKRVADRPQDRAAWCDSRRPSMASRKNDTAVDMSPSAIERRLLELSGLYELCMSLKTARPVRPPSDERKSDPSPRRERG